MARRPLVVVAAVGALSLAGAVVALRLEPSTGTDTLVDRSSESFRATESFKRDFGDEAVVVLVKGDVQRTVLTSDLGRVLKLEGCLSGNVPAQGLAQLPPVCGELARSKPAKVVYGPATFLNTAAGRIQEEFVARQRANEQQSQQAAEAARRRAARERLPRREQERAARMARQAVREQFTDQALRLALRYGIATVPQIDNPEFVSSIVFVRGGRRPGIPKSRFAYLFPSPEAALIQVRLRPDLDDAGRRRAIGLIERATSAPDFRPRYGARYLVTGVPVVAQALADAIQRAIFVLLAAALVVMAATLAMVFRSRLRLLPLGLALAAAALTFGGLSLAGGSLTMASIAVLPVLIGLAVDYAIQFQARFDEARSRRPRPGPARAAETAAATGGPTILAAGVATAVGLLVLLLSPVPMVRGFGALLVVGIVLALACALTAGFATLSRFSESRRPADLPPVFPRLRGWARRPLRRLRGTRGWRRLAARIESGREATAGLAWRMLDRALTEPRRVLGVALAVAVLGWAAETQTEVVSDIRELVPQDLQALQDVRELQRATGVSGEIDVTVRADDITRPEVVGWMTRFQERVLRQFGYTSEKRCTQPRNAPELCPALSLPALFSAQGVADSQQVRALLDAVPRYFSQGVVTPDRRTATLAFGIRLMPLDRQKEVIDGIRRELHPPEGVTASLAGLPVLAAEANGALASPWRRALTLVAALAAVFLALLVIRRRAREAAVPLIPIALATGWSGAVLFVLGLLPGALSVKLNPMSVTLGALVIAISTEFSVLLSARYSEERAGGAGPVRAVELAYGSTGAAVLSSGITAIAGFAVLMATDIRMLRDFGVVTVVDLTVSLLGVMLVLPAALLWAERHGPFTLRDIDPRRLGRLAWEALGSPWRIRPLRRPARMRRRA